MTTITTCSLPVSGSIFTSSRRFRAPSFHEEAVQQYVLEEAKRLGLPAERDAAGNIRVRKPASPGHENAPGVILQSHLDMVRRKMPTRCTTSKRIPSPRKCGKTAG